jgi:hypothetical protein
MGGTISTILKPRSRGDWLLRSHDSFIFDKQTSKSFVDDHTRGVGDNEQELWGNNHKV